MSGYLNLTDALVYSALYSRTTLSEKNGWIDADGRIYIFYSIENLSEDLRKGQTVIKAALRKLTAAGCSEAAAEGGQSFSDYTEALNNCAGSADKMAGTMLDNMNGRLTLMQAAADGLKIAIGEDLTPAMSGLYDVGAQVLGWIQGFVEENPGVVKGIAAGTVTLGGLAGSITAVNAALKLSKALAPALTTVAPVLGTAALAAGGVATVVALLSSAANDTVPSVQELTTAAQNMGSAMKEAGTDYDTALSSMEATASVADQYISKLEAIEAATGGNTSGNAEYHDTLARLSALVPSLANDIDLETDSIKGGTEALRQHTDAYVADAKAQARQDYLNTLYPKPFERAAPPRAQHFSHTILLTSTKSLYDKAPRPRQRVSEGFASFCGCFPCRWFYSHSGSHGGLSVAVELAQCFQQGQEVVADLCSHILSGLFVVDVGGDVAGCDNPVPFLCVLNHSSGKGFFQHSARGGDGRCAALIFQILLDGLPCQFHCELKPLDQAVTVKGILLAFLVDGYGLFQLCQRADIVFNLLQHRGLHRPS